VIRVIRMISVIKAEGLQHGRATECESYAGGETL
jgi:hypothetical protein